MEKIRTVLISAGTTFIAVGALALGLPAFVEEDLGGTIILMILGALLLIFGLKLSEQ